MKVQVLLLAGAGLGQASWWIFGGGDANTENPSEQVTAAIESQDGPTLGTGDEVAEPSLGVPEIVVSRAPAEIPTESPSETLTAGAAEEKPQGSYWSFWPFAPKPATPDLSMSQFEIIEGDKKPVLDVSVHFDEDDLFDDSGAIAFTEPTTISHSDNEQEDSHVVPSDEPEQHTNHVDEKSEEIFTLSSQPEPAFHNRRVRRPAIKSIALPKTASLETIARHFDSLITDNNIARYYFTRMTPLLKKRVKALAALYNFSVIEETSRTVTVKRNKMGQFPDYDEVADLLEADEKERSAKLSSRAYFTERNASLVDKVESVPLNKKGPVTANTAAPTVNAKKAWKRRGGAKLRSRQRKAKLAGQQPPSEEPSRQSTEQSQHQSSTSTSEKSYYFGSIPDIADDYDVIADTSESFFDQPVENLWRWDLPEDSTYHRHYDGSEGDKSDSDYEYDSYDNQDEYDDDQYYGYYDNADYHSERFEQKWKPNALYSSVF